MCLSPQLIEFAKALDAFYVRAQCAGVDRSVAETVLNDEIEKSKRLPYRTTGAALERASRRLVDGSLVT